MFTHDFWAVIALVITQLIAHFFRAAKERRHRAWDLEDRRREADKVAQALTRRADSVANIMTTQAERLAVKTDAQTVQLLGELEKSNTLSSTALTEANRTNSKIRALDERIDAVLAELRQGRCSDGSCQDRI